MGRASVMNENEGAGGNENEKAFGNENEEAYGNIILSILRSRS